MNDRFKFRVWNNKHNRYIVDSHYPIGSDHIIVIKQDGKAYNLGLGDYEDYSNMHSWAVMEEFTDCILEQCTGLKDKNGKLIYEGDIIHEVDKEAEIDDVSQIVWEQDTCHFMKLDLPETGLDRHCILCEDDSPYIEIIGNIHEQPEQGETK
jgi:uncharacterized phage protein (TIGR01671 family)